MLYFSVTNYCHACVLRRPQTSFLWFTSPLKTLRYIVWRNYKWYFIIAILLLIFIIFLILFIYSFPVSVANIAKTWQKQHFNILTVRYHSRCLPIF